jgi:hypothetical protein
MTENRATAILQSFSHALIVGAGLVYLFGYIIVAIYDARYGIADFSPFRAKVIAVGMVFVILILVAMLVTLRTFSLFGLTAENSALVGLAVTPKNVAVVIIYVALALPFGCLALMWPFTFFFAKYSLWTGKGFGLAVVTFVVVSVLGFFSKKWFEVHPFLFIFLSGLNTTAFFVILFRYTHRSVFWFIVWLSFVCAFTLQISFRMLGSERVRKTEWEKLLLTVAVIVFGLYANNIYPNIPHQFGDGRPLPVVLHLTKKMPVFDSDNVFALLVDETEQGYYVLYGSDKAVFVTRGLVEEVEFSQSK